MNRASTALDEDGLDWPSAFRTVQEGIDTAATAAERCEVWVAHGTYHIYRISTGDKLRLRTGVALYGGFWGTELTRDQRDPDQFPTVLDGTQQGAPDLRVLHVVSAIGTSDATLDGFTITGGRADGSQDRRDDRGGGINTYGAALTVSRCLITGNEARFGGGANGDYSRLTILDSHFAGNTTSTQGAGAGLAGDHSHITAQRTRFTANASAGGGGGGAYIDEGVLHLSECTFTGNTAGGGGGVASYASVVEVVDATLVSNSGEMGAGGLSVGDQSMGTISRCRFLNNSAGSSGGGGLSALLTGLVTVESSLFVGNQATFGGAIYAQDYFALSVVNSTLVGNTAATGGGISASGWFGTEPFSVTNAILWGNIPDGVDVTGDPVTVTYSDTQDGGSGTGNISADPLFVASDDFRLQAGSPCIDVADDGAAPLQDLLGNGRIDVNGVGSAVADMGAYEYQP